jgi:CO/xanthine dehydrogenase Mo-binding subunit
VAPMAAVQSAIREAVGIAFTKLPMSPRAVLEGLLQRGE